MSLPLAIIAVLAHFEPCFTQPTWRKALVLLLGTFLARGRRTVTGALRITGHAEDRAFTLFHQVLNRARWVPWRSRVVYCCCWLPSSSPQLLGSRSSWMSTSNAA